jgi:hypothetical protein
MRNGSDEAVSVASMASMAYVAYVAYVAKNVSSLPWHHFTELS